MVRRLDKKSRVGSSCMEEELTVNVKTGSLRNLGQILIAFKSVCEMVKGVLR